MPSHPERVRRNQPDIDQPAAQTYKQGPKSWAQVSQACDVCGLLVTTEGFGNFLLRVRHQHCVLPGTGRQY